MDQYDDRPRAVPAWIRITGVVLVVALVLAFGLSVLTSL